MEQESEQMSVSSLGTKCREPGSRKDPVVAVGHVHVETKCGVFLMIFRSPRRIWENWQTIAMRPNNMALIETLNECLYNHS